MSVDRMLDVDTHKMALHPHSNIRKEVKIPYTILHVRRASSKPEKQSFAQPLSHQSNSLQSILYPSCGWLTIDQPTLISSTGEVKLMTLYMWGQKYIKE
jgi:hypothetical protein